jgi:outer membrane lipoprotein-sorting protein
MHAGRRIIVAASIAMLLLTVRAAFAAPAAPEEKEKERVLRRLDEAAKSFRSTSADFEFDSVETDPIYEKNVQTGKVYFERQGKAFQTAAHIEKENGKPETKVYGVSGGVFKLFESGNLNQVTTFSKASKIEGYLMLGFGASGKELEEKWEIKYLGAETLDGVKTEKLELVAKDPEVRKNVSKVTAWIDPERAVSLKLILNFSATEYKVCVYFNIKVNQPLPPDAFTLKTDKNTVFVPR